MAYFVMAYIVIINKYDLCSYVLQRGSTQFTPSDPKYNTAVDSLTAPGRYIVWSTDMNQRILPKYVVSFSLGGLVPVRKRRACRSMGITKPQ